MYKRLGWLVVACVMGMSLVGPAGAAALEKKKVTVAVGGKTLFYYLPLTIAERRGYFKDEGVEVEIVNLAGGSKALEALVGGSADMTSGAYEHTINMQARGMDIKCVALQGRYSGIVLGLPKGKAAKYKSPADLKGMKIGVTAPGSSTNHMVNLLLSKVGLKPDAVSIIGAGAGPGAVALMRKGELDAMSNLDPVIHQLEANGDIVAVVDTRTAKGMQEVYGGAYGAGSIYLQGAFAQKNPNTTQAVVNAMVRANLWIQENKSNPDAIVAVVPPEYYGEDKAGYKAALIKNLEGYSPDGRVSMEAAQNVYKVLKAFEPSVMKVDVDLKKTFDNSFADKALKKYKK